MAVRAWRVHDTGLVAAPSRFRRLGGLVRHHRGTGEGWPVQVELSIEGGDLVVTGVGRWPLGEVTARRVAAGPPVQFVVEVPGSAQLLAAAAGPATDELLAALG